MRKKNVLSFLLFTFFAINMNAQVSFGLKGGLDVSNLSLKDNDVFTADNRAGFFIGPMVKFTVPLIGLSFDAAALYDQKEAKLRYIDEANTEPTTIKRQSIDIPVNIRYGFGLSSLANIFVFAGPQWAINVGDSEFKWNSTSSYSLKKATVSVNIGAGVTLLKHLQATVNYNFECSNSGTLETPPVADITNYTTTGKSNTWKIAVGYWF